MVEKQYAETGNCTSNSVFYSFPGQAICSEILSLSAGGGGGAAAAPGQPCHLEDKPPVT